MRVNVFSQKEAGLNGVGRIVFESVKRSLHVSMLVAKVEMTQIKCHNDLPKVSASGFRNMQEDSVLPKQ